MTNILPLQMLNCTYTCVKLTFSPGFDPQKWYLLQHWALIWNSQCFCLCISCSLPWSPPCPVGPLLLLRPLLFLLPRRFLGRLLWRWKATYHRLQQFLWQRSVGNRFGFLFFCSISLRGRINTNVGTTEVGSCSRREGRESRLPHSVATGCWIGSAWRTSDSATF